jgi:fatty-acyl-CoA synthase
MTAPFTFNELVHARAADPRTADKPVARLGDRSLTYAEYAHEAAAWAHLMLERRRDAGSVPRVAVLMQNSLEILLAYGGAALSGGMAFALNTGLSGDPLARVVEQSGADLLLADAAHLAVARAAAARSKLDESAVLEVGPNRAFDAELARLREKLGSSANVAPALPALRMTDPWIVLYTSGTTSLPKGIINSHAKLRGIAFALAGLCGLREDDVGYLSMPLFHGSGLFMNFLPAFSVGASVVLRERFTASRFAEDVFESGATFWNYVGQPVHYVLEAMRRAHGGDEKRIREAVTDNPRNKLRLCLGSGAAGPDRAAMQRLFGLEHVYEMYGSTEAEISTYCLPGNPSDSVGEIHDSDVIVVDEHGTRCPDMEFDGGVLVNRDEAVGEIVRRGDPLGMFQGYHQDAEATKKKFSGGFYRSGDLGMIRVIDGRRYLYFAGRTDDWIRKDGENFSAAAVSELAASHPDVDLAVAYGAPHPVSDEWVMVALKLRPGKSFDPRGFLTHCEHALREQGGDAKWLPDLVRVVDDFEWTETHKIRVRDLKAAGYDPERASPVFIRRRGDAGFRPLDRAAYAALRQEFAELGRSELLDHEPGRRALHAPDVSP